MFIYVNDECGGRYPFLLVSFSADGAIEVKPFATEEEAETFLMEKTGLRSLCVPKMRFGVDAWREQRKIAT